MARRPRFIVSLLLAGASVFALEAEAHAAVRGREGKEIEGAQDRRGFYLGGGLGFGGTFFDLDDFVPATELNFNLGGGVTQRLTLGVALHLMPYLAPDAGVAFGGDVEATAYLWRGLHVRTGLGLGGVPGDDGEDAPGRSLSMGLGGRAEAGYEFWITATAALGVALIYDARVVPGSGFPRQTLLVGARITRF